MAKRAFKQFSEEEIAANWNYIQLPLYFCNEANLAPSRALQAGVIVGYSNPRKGTANCTRTHKGFSEELLFSPATSARGIKDIKELSEGGEPILEIVKQSTYRIDKSKLKSRRQIQIEKSIMHHIFEFTDENSQTVYSRPLTKGELLRYSYIVCKWKQLKDRKKGVVASYSDLAEATGGCEKTIGKEIENLINCGLLTRPKHEKGLNGRWKSVYHPDSKLLNWINDVRKKAIKDRRKKAPEHDEEDEAKAAELAKARDDYYAEQRQAAAHRAESNNEIANADSEYVALTTELEAISLGKGKYKMLSVMERVNERIRVLECVSSVLQRHGLTLDDLKPKPRCLLCKDTGYRTSSGKLCDCFPGADLKDLLD